MGNMGLARIRCGQRSRQRGWVQFIPLIAAGVNAAASYFGGQNTNEANTENATANRLWQEQMSNTAHQREVADLTAAGLNPILSVNRSGASTPGGNVPVITNPLHNVLSGASDAARSYADIKKKQQDYNIDKPKEQIMDKAASLIPTGLSAITDTIEAAVGAAVSAALNHDDNVPTTPLEAVGNAAKKIAESVSTTTARGASKVSELATEYGRRTLDTIKAPGGYVDRAVSSARDAHRLLSEKHIRPGTAYSRLEGPPPRVWDEISRIPDAKIRAQVSRAYQQQLNRERF